MTTSLNINLERVKESKLASTDFGSLEFGKSFSDHMFVVNYSEGKWQEPKIMPFQALSFNPSMASLHYGQTIFEGLKAFKNGSEDVFMFRPEEHSRRLNDSAKRLCMPELPEAIFLEGIYALIDVDKEWIPKDSGSSLYIRPVMFATDQALGVAPSQNYTFVIMTCPVGSYYDGAVKVVIEEEYVRASEGGVGFTKSGGNYAASLFPAMEAQKKGYDQLLWTDSKEHKYIEEAGTMNVMFEIDGKIITPKTTSSILSGITRKSIVDLAKKWGIEIEERRVTIEEILEAHKSGKLTDAFGTGTAATISHISAIGYRGNDMELPAVESRGFSNKAKEYLSNLKIGEAQDYMGWMKQL